MSMAAIVIRIIAGKACLDNYSSHQVEKEEVVLMISIVKAIIIIGPLDYLYPAMLTTKLLDLLWILIIWTKGVILAMIIAKVLACQRQLGMSEKVGRCY